MSHGIAFPTATAPRPPETAPRARIQPLGEQIIIRTIPQHSVGSILIPDSAKGITMMGEKGAEDAKHFVEAEVIAVGPGKRQKGDAELVRDMAAALQTIRDGYDDVDFQGLFTRFHNRDTRILPLVHPGDRILYHPAVQRFDRDITSLMSDGNEGTGVKYFMIREESVLAVIERD